MRVGLTEHAPWTVLKGDEPAGFEVQLVREFAKEMEARIEWRRGSESQLVDAMREGKLDLIIGGMKKTSPWSKHVGMTRPYLILGKDKHVFMVRQGENRWLLVIDRFLERNKEQIDRFPTEEERP